jgi:hypothetical protein
MAYGTLALALWHIALAQMAHGNLALGAMTQSMAWLGTVAWRGIGMAQQGAGSKAYGIRHPGTGTLAQSARSTSSGHSGTWR